MPVRRSRLCLDWYATSLASKSEAGLMGVLRYDLLSMRKKDVDIVSVSHTIYV